MTDDTLTRVRAALARLAEVEREATPGPWVADDVWIGRIEAPDGEVIVYDEGAPGEEDAAAIVALRNAAPALLALAEAVAMWQSHVPYSAEAWFEDMGDDEQGGVYCIGCGGEVRRKAPARRPVEGHAPDCPAVAIDAALAALADAPGEVQP